MGKSTPTIKVVEAAPLFGLRGYSFRCTGCSEAGAVTDVKAHAEQAGQMHLARVHRR